MPFNSVSMSNIFFLACITLILLVILLVLYQMQRNK